MRKLLFIFRGYSDQNLSPVYVANATYRYQVPCVEVDQDVEALYFLFLG